MNRTTHFPLFLAVSLSVISMSVVSMTAVAQNTASSCALPAWVTEDGPGYDLQRHILNDDLCSATFVHAPASNLSMAPNRASVMNAMAVQEYQPSGTYLELVERQRSRAAQEAAIRSGESWYSSQKYEDPEPPAHAKPDAPDQSERMKNSHDPDFILRNFRTMYVEAQARYFDRNQMIAALGKNPNFKKLNIRIVDDPNVADTVLHVGYTFAWDFPFKLRHQNTTIVLASGKGEGPFSGPLGAADVARQFVKSVEEWRSVKGKSNH